MTRASAAGAALVSLAVCAATVTAARARPARPAPAPPVAALAGSVPVTGGPTADEVVAKVQAYYARVGHLTALFRQEVTNASFGQKTRSQGLLQVARPGRMRWDYFGKARAGKAEVRRSFIFDGGYLFVVDWINQEVFRKRVDQDLLPVAISFLYGKGDLRAEFRAELRSISDGHGHVRDLVVALAPRKPSAQYKALYLIVDPGDFRVRESIVVDASDDVNHFRFYLPDVATAVPADRFGLDPTTSGRFPVHDLGGARPAGAGSGRAAP